MPIPKRPFPTPRSLWKRGRRWILWTLILCPWSLVALAFLPRPGATAASALTLWLSAGAAVAACAGLLFAFLKLRGERDTVRVGYRARFADPLLPVLGRTSFRLEVFAESVDRGKKRRTEECTIEARLRSRGGVEALEWCCRQVDQQLTSAASRLALAHPESRVIRVASPSPAELASKLESCRTLPWAGPGRRAWHRLPEMRGLAARATGAIRSRLPCSSFLPGGSGSSLPRFTPLPPLARVSRCPPGFTPPSSPAFSQARSGRRVGPAR